ncbi:tRNA (adenosine(37)-N6)-threonylcarbamoyltransferase complex dimerization subunit type 1 TsaB [Paenibacillus apiarius]|uniref:tRNA (Adenosine(37)-N6)-threonylcarbamoyltransferase complex dimerization subunit type 1 TsaB n=1 Tax=Paenibacillus apiarius TaxID=46240 RepID=A0ABT4DUT2_9BACL|nr:tRNA (adenosine(37)-N6)-threonylcarbamoyltransferase complex dimerization subunit type 1 TsaB [Paenibacillus apiarius]MCY9514354.1 tRNA (adenosine(37)-N6)-threonylcarbamoyltransferase complex dimerization subunit type 1 TsaB [Paenibacillus apiarius]MCY9521108.1 tRNA (adenosine(37)-N6)-threonylcarbamoyltransferase complex dimerization subunit type 1 TsaB [Paenibacillus apiarius]MCY9551955.1 tRNA (adenosine(37)-N6)-threonylcarbamoyltransferase complex dimerization subunit type 1 TsaB [Paenibaci
MAEQQGIHNEQVLALDTSTAMMTVALLRQKQVVSEHESQAERNHSIMLVPAIQSMMKEQGWAGNEMDLVTVGVGPGSYTGVRIAVTAAKTVAWAWQKPVIGVSSLHALALSGMELCLNESSQPCDSGEGKTGDWIFPLMDARRGQVYTARFAVDDGTTEDGYPYVRREQEDGIRLFSQIAEEIEQALRENGVQGEHADRSVKRVWFVGEMEQQRDRIEALQAQFGGRIQAVPCTMKPHWIGRLGLQAWRSGERTDTHRLEPNYTQLAEAEAKLLAKEQAAARANK